MKILMSALACEPRKGSELEVGFRAMSAAASEHDVWVLTNSATIPIARQAIEKHPWADRVHFEGIYFDVDDESYPQLTAPAFHWYYDRWQRKAAIRAAELDQRVDFDIVHHVTMAACWTRAGVSSVDKPLVWGPVGGGVEMPPCLFGELGWRGVIDEASRFVARHLLARVGPARGLQQRAVVVFAQNDATTRMIRTRGRVRVMPNATSVDVRDVVATAPRRKDILFAARLLPWKGGRLAIRALRYVQHPDALLRICGEGPERKRMARAARRWGVADRVLFEGRVERDVLLRLIATAGAFVHPSFHDEAGLAVAEALSLGTPVVCLDRGGPPELLRYWPEAHAVAVRPASAESTARALAAAIDRFLFNPPPIPDAPRRAVTSFEEELLAAYEVALEVGRDQGRRSTRVWGFPAGKPQLFADMPRALSKGVTVYGFGRRLPRCVQSTLAMQVRIPVIRRLLAEPVLRPEPVCGWIVWHAIVDQVQRRNGRSSLEWIHFRSQWGKERSSALGLEPDGTPCLFVVVEPEQGGVYRGRIPSTGSFRVAECRDSFSYETWSVRQYEPLPRFHRPARWEARKMRRVAEDVSVGLAGVLPRADGIPDHWRPMHGDYVPWNLREDDHGQLWLLDWEDAAWGPPLADFIRYVVAWHSLGWSRPARIAAIVRRVVAGGSPEALLEVAAFWLSHPNLQPGRADRRLTRREARDTARSAREIAALRLLASRPEEPLTREEAPACSRSTRSRLRL